MDYCSRFLRIAFVALESSSRMGLIGVVSSASFLSVSLSAIVHFFFYVS